MTSELFRALEERVDRLLEQYALLKRENERLTMENHKMTEERNSFRSRIDFIIKKLEDFDYS